MQEPGEFSFDDSYNINVEEKSNLTLNHSRERMKSESKNPKEKERKDLNYEHNKRLLEQQLLQMNENTKALNQQLTTFLGEKKYQLEQKKSFPWKTLLSSFLAIALFVAVLWNSSLFVTFIVIIALVSVFLTVLLKAYNWDLIFIDLIVIILSFIFLIGKWVKFFFYAFLIVLLLYFIYLAIRRQRSFAFSVVITFFILIYSFQYYFPNASKFLPFVEKASKQTSQITLNAQRNVFSNLLANIQEAFLPVLNPEAYAEKISKADIQKHELPKLGELSNMKINKIDLGSTSNNLLLMNNYKTSIDVGFLIYNNKKLIDLLKKLNVNDDFFRINFSLNCAVIDEVGEKSGVCNVSGSSNLVKDLREDFDNELNYKLNIENFEDDSNLKLFAKSNYVQIAFGSIEKNKLKAAQFNNLLSVSLKLYKINESDKFHYSLYLYLVDKLRSGNYIVDDVIPTINGIERLNYLYICFDKINNQDVVNKLDVYYLGEKLNVKEVNFLRNSQCFEIDKDRVFLSDYLPYRIEIYLNSPYSNMKEFQYYIWQFEIFAKYTLDKISQDNAIKIKFINKLIPLVFFIKYKRNVIDNPENFYLTALDAGWQFDYDKEKEFLDNLYNKLENLNLDFIKNLPDLGIFGNDKEKMFGLILLSYLYHNYNLNKLSICDALKINTQNCNADTVSNILKEKLNQVNKILFEDKKINCLCFANTFNSLNKANTRLIITTLDLVIKNPKNLYCKNICDAYFGGNSVDKIRNALFGYNTVFDQSVDELNNVVYYLIRNENPFN